MRHLGSPLPDAHLLEIEPRIDERGSFVRLFCAQELRCLGVEAPCLQANLSRTRRVGTVRGLHFQRPPHAEIKIVHCLQGAVHDVVLDLRTTSPTFGQSRCFRLSAQNRRALVVPAGCAHGFQSLDPDCVLLYFVSAAYRPEAEAGVRFDDPVLGDVWPLPPVHLSARDRAFADLDLPRGDAARREDASCAS